MQPAVYFTLVARCRPLDPASSRGKSGPCSLMLRPTLPLDVDDPEGMAAEACYEICCAVSQGWFPARGFFSRQVRQEAGATDQRCRSVSAYAASRQRPHPGTQASWYQ